MSTEIILKLKTENAQLQADLIAARKERDEARASLEECAELVSEYAAAAVPEGMEILAKDRDKWFDAAQAAEAEAAQLRSRLLQAEKGAEAMRAELQVLRTLLKDVADEADDAESDAFLLTQEEGDA